MDLEDYGAAECKRTARRTGGGADRAFGTSGECVSELYAQFSSAIRRKLCIIPIPSSSKTFKMLLMLCSRVCKDLVLLHTRNV